MKLSEMFQTVDLLYDEWDLGKTEAKAKGKICAWIYLMEILEEAEDIIMHKEKNKLIGIGGYVKENSNKSKIRKRFYKTIKKILLKSPIIKNKSELYKYLEYYEYTPKQLENKFDGEINILIVDKKYRRKGIGKKLLLKIFENAKKEKIKRLKILTDEACNFKFYEKYGCKKIYETVIPNGEPNKCKGNITKGFIYEKVLN